MCCYLHKVVVKKRKKKKKREEEGEEEEEEKEEKCPFLYKMLFIEIGSVATASSEETADSRQSAHNVRHGGNTRDCVLACHLTSSGIRRFRYVHKYY
ncbi:unnamed protein product [Hydatigera taeniaeformis]|uniref:Uncharacterized protein n=1 Tax=Hydatigena taeniaeformis TaxID=6205 RepID=A0A0R3WYU2_HYDTA|nr:unnamed protein product [Hydatigera taeniaeformis]